MSFRLSFALPFLVMASAASAAPAATVQQSRAIPPDAQTWSPSQAPVRVVTEPRLVRVAADAAPEASALRSPASRAPGVVPEVGEGPSGVDVAAAVRREPAVERIASRAPAPSKGGLEGEVRCVAQAVFHEARGEPSRGQRAVADVVMNRARSGRWGVGACAVVNAPRQFSNRWSWRAPQIGVAAWDQAIAIAREAVSGAVGVSSRLMNFRAAAMGAGGLRALRIGNHVFW